MGIKKVVQAWNSVSLVKRIVIGLVIGGVLGVAGMFLMADFPAGDVLTAAAVGIVSGLAATGVDQAGKQLFCK